MSLRLNIDTFNVNPTIARVGAFNASRGQMRWFGKEDMMTLADLPPTAGYLAGVQTTLCARAAPDATVLPDSAWLCRVGCRWCGEEAGFVPRTASDATLLP